MPETNSAARVAGRRHVQLRSVADLRREVEAIIAAAQNGTIRAGGNWSAPQILRHVAQVIAFSYDGFPSRPPWPIRWMGRLWFRLRRRQVLEKPFPPGFRTMNEMLPEPDVSLERAAAQFRALLLRLEAGEPIVRASPLFGKLTHTEWMQLHLRHAELHFSFIHY